MFFISDVHGEGCKNGTTAGSVHLLPRPKGCLLAYSHPSGVQGLSRILNRYLEVPTHGAPFGFNIAPRIFTKLCRAIQKELMVKSIGVLAYLDDGLVWGASEEECLRNTEVVTGCPSREGLLVNWTKSRLVPSLSFIWLGIHWDTSLGWISMPADRSNYFGRNFEASFPVRQFPGGNWSSYWASSSSPLKALN